MYSDWSVLAGLVVAAIFIWLGILSFFVWKQGNFLKSLFPKSGDRDIRKKFAEIITEVENFRGELKDLEEGVAYFEKSGLKHVQRVALLRFNPYQETGGDQSFTIALLDGLGDGFVVTSLHARSGTRVFAKPIKMGRGVRYQLSSEEEEVLRKALSDE